MSDTHSIDDTHYACDEQVALHRDGVPCCRCHGHKCKPTSESSDTHTDEELRKLVQKTIGVLEDIPDDEDPVVMAEQCRKYEDEVIRLIHQRERAAKREVIQYLSQRNDQYKAWCDCPTCEDLKCMADDLTKLGEE